MHFSHFPRNEFPDTTTSNPSRLFSLQKADADVYVRMISSFFSFSVDINDSSRSSSYFLLRFAQIPHTLFGASRKFLILPLALRVNSSYSPLRFAQIPHTLFGASRQFLIFSFALRANSSYFLWRFAPIPHIFMALRAFLPHFFQSSSHSQIRFSTVSDTMQCTQTINFQICGILLQVSN